MSWPTLYALFHGAARASYSPATSDKPGSPAAALGGIAGSVATPPAPAAGWFDDYANEYTGEAVGDEDWTKAASDLSCEVAAIKAIAAVESGPLGAFGKPGWPIILYERHLFSAATARKFDAQHPGLSAKTGYRWPTKEEKAANEPLDDVYAWTQDMNYARLEKAYGLDQSAALKSASWGKFQILGRNHAAAGYASVEHYVRAMCTSEKAQLAAFVSFLKADAKLLKALQDKNWAGFAEIYNGTNYKQFNYDTRMQAAYDKEKPPTPSGVPT